MSRRLALLLALSGAATLSASAQELVRNGTFDRDLSHWTGNARWFLGDDALGNALSGSAYTGFGCGMYGCSSTHLWQCVPVRPGGVYRLSLYEHGSAGAYSTEWYSSSDCTTGLLPPAGGATLDYDHWAFWEAPVSAPSDAHSVKLRLNPQPRTVPLFTSVGASWDNVSLRVISEPPAVPKTLLIPTAANAQGLFGARFKTRLTLLSFGSALTASVRLQVLPPAGRVGVSRTLDLLPGVTTTLGDVLGEIGYEGGAAIEVTYAEDQPLYVTAEVYSDSSTGRYTTVVPVIADPLTDRLVLTPGISNSLTAHTNLGCANITDAPEHVYAEVHGADGSGLGVLDLSVPSRGWVQTPSSFPVSDGYVLWSTGSGIWGAPRGVSCFAVVVDNVTNDGSLLR